MEFEDGHYKETVMNKLLPSRGNAANLKRDIKKLYNEDIENMDMFIEEIFNGRL
jgi:hypothetical protein